ncbi:DUF3180 family protein [Flaviflexus huanghaiensis]|uniref:DUF3180 family protein n=1 Tax=Flaviflexus huanghaiensis TaxID=1111473 RepID=UPI0015FA1E1A|nr:DUF3180 family protein [Flaviflexus huanghaiensis]
MTSPLQMASWFFLGLLTALLGVSVWLDSAMPLVSIPQLAWTIPLILAITVLSAAWQVRGMAKGGAARVNPLTAARIAIFSQACSRGGMLLGGIGIGMWLAVDAGQATYLDEQASHALWTGVASVLLGGAGLLGEWWCSIDEDEDEPPAAAAGA